MLLFWCGCSNMVLYVWNQGFDCIFCDSNGLNKVPIFSALKLWFKMPSQLNKGLFNKLVSIILPTVKLQFCNCIYNVILRKDNNCTWIGCVESNVAMYDGAWYTTLLHFEVFFGLNDICCKGTWVFHYCKLCKLPSWHLPLCMVCNHFVSMMYYCICYVIFFLINKFHNFTNCTALHFLKKGTNFYCPFFI